MIEFAQRLPLAESTSVHVVSGVVASLPETKGDVVRFLYFYPMILFQPVPSRLKDKLCTGTRTDAGQ